MKLYKTHTHESNKNSVTQWQDLQFFIRLEKDGKTVLPNAAESVQFLNNMITAINHAMCNIR